MISLHAYNREVRTPFGLIGTDENALTFALGYTMQQCPRLFQLFLRDIGIPGIHLSSLRAAEIHLQKRRKQGITDIEITLGKKFHIIVEAKIDFGLPSIKACKRYIEPLQNSNARVRKLIILLDTDGLATVEHYHRKDDECKKFLTAFQWAKLFDMQYRLFNEFGASTTEGFWLRSFFDFLNQEYAMRSFTSEVWIVPASTQPLWKGGWSHYEAHTKGLVYYRETHTKNRPLYMAFRCRGKVEAIQRVLKIEHETRLIDRIPQFENVPRGWPKKLHTIWHLSEPTRLPNPIPTGDSSMRQRHVYCDIDILLSSSSIREAEKRMKERRSEKRR